MKDFDNHLKHDKVLYVIYDELFWNRLWSPTVPFCQYIIDLGVLAHCRQGLTIKSSSQRNFDVHLIECQPLAVTLGAWSKLPTSCPPCIALILTTLLSGIQHLLVHLNSCFLMFTLTFYSMVKMISLTISIMIKVWKTCSDVRYLNSDGIVHKVHLRISQTVFTKT